MPVVGTTIGAFVYNIPGLDELQTEFPRVQKWPESIAIRLEMLVWIKIIENP
jgi:hypothetical protein